MTTLKPVDQSAFRVSTMGKNSIGVMCNENTQIIEAEDRAALGLDHLLEQDLMLPKMDHNNYKNSVSSNQ